MIDNHVHIGWYTNGYHTPKKVWQSEKEAGIDNIVVSSTSTCAEMYKLVVREMLELYKLDGSNIHPILWLTPRMMKTWGLNYMLHSKIQWQGIKMHWGAHREWYYNKKFQRKALEIARRLEVPVLLHTGNDKECKASVFMDICKQYNDLTFVLAHGRPIEDTLNVLNKCSNVFVDTAFMPIDNVKLLCDKGFTNRIQFGTDAPINLLYYKNMSTSEYINSCISNLKQNLSYMQFQTIMTNSCYKHKS